MTLIQASNGPEAPVYVPSEDGNMVRLDNSRRYVSLDDHLEMLKRREDQQKRIDEFSSYNYALEQRVTAIRRTVSSAMNAYASLKSVSILEQALRDIDLALTRPIPTRESATPDR